MTNTGKHLSTSARKKLKSVKEANAALKDSLEKCAICPRKCNVDRLSGKKGYCRAPAEPVIYSYIDHHGEEPPISGTMGSGTIFFSHCNMKCAYCQNYYFSQLDNGRRMSSKSLSDIILRLQMNGCHNINLVSPTHFVPQILLALETAIEGGLEIPIVYNTSGYDLVDTIKLLRGIVDIYLPDMRYSDNAAAAKYSDATDYVTHNRSSVREMKEQTGRLEMGQNGIGLRGIIIRLLALPFGISGTLNTLRFIAENVSKGTYLSIMSQYYPTYKAYNYKELSTGTAPEEYQNVVDGARLLGLNSGWVQESPSITDPGLLGTNIRPNQDI